MENLHLTELEHRLLSGSKDTSITQKRITITIVFAILFFSMLWLAAYITPAVTPLLIVSSIYIGMTLLEKIAYGKAVIAYKLLIQKLVRRIEDLEARRDDHPG